MNIHISFKRNRISLNHSASFLTNRKSAMTVFSGIYLTMCIKCYLTIRLTKINSNNEMGHIFSIKIRLKELGLQWQTLV